MGELWRYKDVFDYRLREASLASGDTYSGLALAPRPGGVGLVCAGLSLIHGPAPPIAATAGLWHRASKCEKSGKISACLRSGPAPILGEMLSCRSPDLPQLTKCVTRVRQEKTERG